MSDDKLKPLRDQIDAIDAQLLALLNERARVAQQVGHVKAETNAPENHVNDWEWGVEWQIAPEVEIAAVYHHMKRTNMTTSGKFNTENGSYQTFNAEALRIQLQYNFP